MAGPMATFTSGKSRFTAWAITWDVEWRSVGKGSGRQSNSPANSRCRASSDDSAMTLLFQRQQSIPGLRPVMLATPSLAHARPASDAHPQRAAVKRNGRLGRFRTADLYRVKVALSH